MSDTGRRLDAGDVLLRTLRGTAIALAIALLGVYLTVAGLRLSYPFELEWMEGAVVDEVQRLASGRGLYVEPSIGFVPFVYPPLYFHVVAVVSPLVGGGFLPARLVSVAASLVCLFLIYYMVRRRTGNAAAGLLSAALFAACYQAGGAWLDIARPDSLSLMLALGGLAAAANSRGRLGVTAAGVLLALACLAKQSALPVAIAITVWWLVHRRERAAFGIGALLSVLAASTIWLEWRSSGWYLYYVWQVPQHHPVTWERVALFWRDDLAAHLPVAILFAAAALAGWHRRPEDPRKGLLAFGGVGLLLSSWLIRVRTGSFDNVLIPAFAGAALLFGLGLSALLDLARGAAGTGRRRLEALVWAPCILQFLVLIYDPRDQIPRPADREVGRRLVARLRAIPGPVYVPAHGYLPALAGKPASAHWIAINDVLKAGGPVADHLQAQIASAIDHQEFAAVVADRRLPPFLDVGQRYVELEDSPLIGDDDSFWPVTGYHTRPERILLPTHPTDRPAPDAVPPPRAGGKGNG